MNLDTLLDDYKKALESLKAAEQREGFARNETCAARNCVNELQKRIDAHLADLKKAAPGASDWHRKTELKP